MTRFFDAKSKKKMDSAAALVAKKNDNQRRYDDSHPKILISQLCAHFYELGWVTGTGGGISVRQGERVFVAPSGVQKEDLIPDDMFELDMNQQIVKAPVTPGLKQSACTPLWFVVYKQRPEATSVIHTHSMWAQLATMLNGEECKELRITHFEMLKGVGGHGYEDELVVPIIDNRPTEDLLAEQLEQAVIAYPKANAVLVRRHGVYVWGNTWQQAKTQCECFDYLFETAVRLRGMGIDCALKPQISTYREEGNASKKQRTEECNGGCSH